MPERDPDTVELPDGRFFNAKLKAFVEGPQVGAKPKVDSELPKRRGRPRGVPNKAKSTPANEAPETKVEAESEPVEVADETPQDSQPVEEPQQTDVSPSKDTAPTTAAMDVLLKAVLPAKK